jgi:hypothetical protein
LKKETDVNLLLSYTTSDVGDLAQLSTNFLYHYLLSHSPVLPNKPHPEYERLKKEGILKNLLSSFEECEFPNAKINLCLFYLNLHRNSELPFQWKETVGWLRDKAKDALGDDRLFLLLIFRDYSNSLFFSLLFFFMVFFSPFSSLFFLRFSLVSFFFAYIISFITFSLFLF